MHKILSDRRSVLSDLEVSEYDQTRKITVLQKNGSIVLELKKFIYTSIY